ncbi:MAG: phosphodiester glycosidase family protein [Bacteroidetes bacterium]|nr:phosphodiester glycosidase family protein [Bacteroidota bacterium]
MNTRSLRSIRPRVPARNRVLLAVALLLLWPLAGCSSLVQSLQNQECALHAARPFDVVEIDLDRHEVRLFWKQPDSQPFLTLDRVHAWVTGQGDSLIAATNAGIYEPGYVPTGLFIEDGDVKHPLNLDDGAGNFYLKPNGVFLLTDTGARIVESSRFESVTEAIRYATQSGPLLVSGGVIHPGFTPGSSNCRLRSGIGVSTEGTVYLVISNGALNFYDFATFFKEQLNCPDALYLDGAISSLYAPALGRFEGDREKYAGILGVVLKR